MTIRPTRNPSASTSPATTMGFRPAVLNRRFRPPTGRAAAVCSAARTRAPPGSQSAPALSERQPLRERLRWSRRLAWWVRATARRARLWLRRLGQDRPGRSGHQWEEGATTNVAPRPGPALEASMVPPCSSTRCFAIERPRPSPQAPRVVDDPPGGSARTRAAGSPARCPGRCRCTLNPQRRRCSAAARDLDAPAGRRELDGVVHQIPQHLLQRAARRPEHGGTVGSTVAVSWTPLRVGRRLQALHRRLQQSRRHRRGAISSWTLPDISRFMSSRSSISCACIWALRSNHRERRLRIADRLAARRAC